MEDSVKIDTGRIRIKFTELDGTEFASLVINPTDVHLLERARQLAEELDSASDEEESLVKRNDEIEERICRLLGYDAKAELFGVLPGTTIFPDGRIFAHCVLDTIVDKLMPAIEQRSEAMREQIRKYTGKYSDRI